MANYTFQVEQSPVSTSIRIYAFELQQNLKVYIFAQKYSNSQWYESLLQILHVKNYKGAFMIQQSWKHEIAGLLK